MEKINPLGIDVSSGGEEINSMGGKYKSFKKIRNLIGEVKKHG
jgi:phosphoribosylanthranilate isomerase